MFSFLSRYIYPRNSSSGVAFIFSFFYPFWYILSTLLVQVTASEYIV